MVNDIQKAGFFKRLSAFLLDSIIFILVAVAIAVPISAIISYPDTVEAFETHYKKYEEKYAIDTNMSAAEYDKLTPEQKERYEEATRELANDKEIIELYTALMNKTVLVVLISLFFAFIVTELAIPMFLKNGQTLGKKMVSIGVMRVDGVRLSSFQLFVRSIFGKFLLETMIPTLVIMMEMFGVMSGMGVIITGLILIIQTVLVIVTKTNSAIHDYVAVTVVVDMNGQTIFDSPEELIEYKKRLHEEEVRNAPY